MKNIKRIILLLAVSGAVFSCDDAIDIVQDGELNESAAFQSVDDVQTFLTGVYDQGSIRDQVGFTSVFTDETGIGSQSGGQNLDVYGYSLNAGDTFTNNIWLTNYTLINYANRCLRGAARVTPSEADQARYNSMLAEARVLRALGHLQLLTYFSTNMKDDNALGVILMDRVPSVEEDLPRSTNAEIFALIESDLAYADANLVDHTGTSAYKYITRNFLNAFRARMYAYRGNYTQAEIYADLAIAGGPALVQAGAIAGPYVANTTGPLAINFGYPTATNNFYAQTGTGPSNQYAAMWGDFSQGEIIFAFARVAIANQEQIANLWYFNRTQLNGGPYHDMDRTLMNLLQDPMGDGMAPNNNPGSNDHDIRRPAFIDPTSNGQYDAELPGDFRTQNVICIDKYRGKTGPAGSEMVNDQKVMRMSEVVLIKAEARVAAGDLGGAATLIKQIRDARTYTATGQPVTVRPLPVYADATAAWVDILRERRVELCYEGHRYIDLKRLGGVAGVTIDRFHRECETNNISICALPVTDYRFTLPIPNPEMIANGNIQQNPNYN